jgi:virulence-associated protein VapD
MLAISFDLTVSEVERLHPRSIPAAYGEIGRTLARYGYERIQGSVYLGQDEDLANLMMATSDLKALPWFPASVRDIRVFRVELWSDITAMMKGATVKR